MKRIGILGTTILFAVFGFTVRMQAQDQHDKDAAPEKHEEAKPAEHHDDKASKPEKQDAKPQEQQRHEDDKAAKENEHQQQQQNKDAEKAAKDQQKDQEKAAQDQQKQQKDQQKQAGQQEKAAQHDEQNNNSQRRNDQPASDQQRQDNQRSVDRQRADQQSRQQDNRPSSQPQRANAGEQRTTWQAHRASNWKSQHRDWQQRGGYHGYHIPEDRFRATFGEGHNFHLASYPVEVVEGFPRFQINGFWFALVDPWPEFWADDWYETDDCYIDYYDGGYYLEDVRYPGVRLAINVFVG